MKIKSTLLNPDNLGTLSFTQWTFWYRNDIAVTSPSILVWHCWYIVNEHMTMSICDINLTSGSWDWTNQTLMSSWHRHDNGRSERNAAEINPPESYTFSVSATIMLRNKNSKHNIKNNLHLYLLKKTNLLISCKKLLMSAEFKECITWFIYFLDLL